VRETAVARSQKTRPTGADVEAFLAAVPDERRRADARTLCALLAEVTGERPALWGTSIVGFGTYHYRYESGHEGTSALASFSPRKAHLVLYLVGGFEDRHGKLLAKLGPHKTGKGCLYLKSLADVDLDVLRELVERSARIRRGVDRASGPAE
jgi:hypothetical protein